MVFTIISRTFPTTAGMLAVTSLIVSITADFSNPL